MRTKSVLLGLVVILAAYPLYGHCESINGPAATVARAALANGDVKPVLTWVPAAKEHEIHYAFVRALSARSASPHAKALADEWFVATVVRIHSAASETQLAGTNGAMPVDTTALADDAIIEDCIDIAQKHLLDAVTAGLQTHFAAVQDARKHATHSVAEGRLYVAAYLDYLRYVERLDEAANDPARPNRMGERTVEK